MTPLNICLIMHSTRSDNLGVGALTVSEVAIIRDIARDLNHPIQITVMDWKDPRAPALGRLASGRSEVAAGLKLTLTLT